MSTHEINPNNIDEKIYKLIDSIEVLSLDCFDTLFWRSVNKPIDIFFNCAKKEKFLVNKITASKRAKAESTARIRSQMEKRTNEVSINDIYKELGISQPDIEELIELEISAEIESGYIYEPIFNFIKYAKRRNKKVIIVSDIYFSSKQLKNILYAVCSELELYVDDVYTSSDFNCGKYSGLWKIIPQIRKVKAYEIMHIGDNYQSDYCIPRELGVNAYHLNINQKYVNEIDNQREIAVAITDKNARIESAIMAPFKGLISEINIDTPEKAIGYCFLGPVMLSFGIRINEFLLANKNKYNRIHPCFLLRDGYLISRVMKKMLPDGAELSLLNISRATALASSITNTKDIDEILIKFFNVNNYDKIFKQIELDDEINKRIKYLEKSTSNFDIKIVRDLLIQKKVSDKIFDKSKKSRNKLIKHIKTQVNVNSGDAILFIDLGYEGTAQKLLHKSFREDLNAELMGCYLISYETSNKWGERCGVIDHQNFDSGFMLSILGSRIAAFEMLCTQDSPSVIGYTDDGKPIFSELEYKKKQSDLTNSIQSYCLDFIDKWINKQNYFKPKTSNIELSKYVASELARFSYLPTKSELELLSMYEFDLNLGTDLKGRLFDLEYAYNEVCANGITSFQDGDKLDRISLQFELRAINATYSIASYIMNRQGINFDFNQISYYSKKIPLVFTMNNKEFIIEVDSRSTHDGFYSLMIPAKKDRSVGVIFGAVSNVVQFFQIKLNFKNYVKIIDINNILIENALVLHEKIYSFEDDGLVFIGSNLYEDNLVAFEIIWRPID